MCSISDGSRRLDKMTNLFLSLPYESALADLGDDYYDAVTPATFPKHVLRFRNDDVLQQMGLSADEVSDRDFTQAFGEFSPKKRVAISS